MERITGLVRRLVDAGRLATSPAALGVTRVEGAVRGAAEEAQALFGEHLRLTWRIEPGLRAAIPAEVLHDVLLALLLHAAEGATEDRACRVEVVGAVDDEGSLALAVTGDGRGHVGAPGERAAEPLFATMPTGQVVGLGLALARALAERHGGTLTLARRDGGGSLARLELRLAPPVD
jgi:two-component system C4-dicarboxylate transport sensor histidine kinase DctB